MTLKSFAIVLTGDSFPVSSIRMSDLEFRHREFRETLRIGPAVQGQARGVELMILPNRFNLIVTELDDLEIQMAGARGVVERFREYVGVRTLSAVGINAQILISPAVGADMFFRRLFLADNIRAILEGATDLRGKATISFRYGNETITNLTAGVEDNGDVLLDFNFHYDLAEGRDLATALDDLPACIEAATTMSERFEASLLTGEVVQ